MIGHMKTFLLIFVSALGMAQSAPAPLPAPQPSDSAIAAYWKADGAESALKAEYDAILENFKRQLNELIGKQINARVQALIAGNQLVQACGEYVIDAQALAQREVKCVEKPKTK